MATRPDRDIEELIAELAQAQKRVLAIYAKLRNARHSTLPRIGRTDDGALIVAGYLETYYTGAFCKIPKTARIRGRAG